MLVTLFSDGFSDLIKKVKKKRKNNIAFPRKKKVFTKGRHSHYSSAQKAAYLTLVFFLIEISLVENNSVLRQTKKMLLRFCHDFIYFNK